MSGSTVFNLVQFGLILPAVALLWFVLWRQKQNPTHTSLLERFARRFLRKTDDRDPPDHNNDSTPST
jgi:hypothetical protein